MRIYFLEKQILEAIWTTEPVHCRWIELRCLDTHVKVGTIWLRMAPVLWLQLKPVHCRQIESGCSHVKVGTNLATNGTSALAANGICALQVQSPLEYATNGERKPLGRIVSSKRLLEAAGWEVFVLNAGQLPSFASEPAMLGTVGRFLHSIGFTTDWKATAASAPRSVFIDSKSRALNPKP